MYISIWQYINTVIEIEYVKIYCSSGTFDTHSKLVISDEHSVCQINQSLPEILPSYPLKNSTNYQIKITNLPYMVYLVNTHAFQNFTIFINTTYTYSNNITSILDHISISNCIYNMIST